MSKLTERSLILVEAESTYGTDPTPTVSANAIITSVPELEFLDKTIERNTVRNVFGQNDKRAIIEGCKISFSVELRTGDYIDIDPKIAPLLLACGLSKVASTGVDIQFKVSDSLTQSSCTIYFYQDSILRKITGCRGTFKLIASVNEIVELQFEMQGFYNAASDATPSTPTFEGNEPIYFNNVTLTSGDLTDGNVDKFELDLGNQLEKIADCTAANGISEFKIVNRKITGSFSREADSIAHFDPIALWAARDTLDNDYTVTMGPTGNVVAVILKKVYLDKPKITSKNGLMWVECPFSIQRAAFDSTTFETIFKFIGPAA